eukprot:s1489_g20.t2
MFGLFDLPQRSAETPRRDSEARDPAEVLQTAAVEVAEGLAQRHFGWPRLRSFQRRSVEAWAAGRSCFVLSGTGSGKSGCFILPALVERHWHQTHGSQGPAPVALVISPLVSLMHDQAQRLRQHGLSAVVCSPQGGEASWPQVLHAVQNGAFVVFMSPERALKEVHSQRLKQLQRVSLVAIDEAHCVSEWGHDFRAEYDQLSFVAGALAGTGRSGGTPPVLALTATCKSEVRHDVVRSLELPAGTEHIIGSMNRPMLCERGSDGKRWPPEAPPRALCGGGQMAVMASGSTESAVAERRVRPIETLTVSPYSPTIIYCIRKRDAENVAAHLSQGVLILVSLSSTEATLGDRLFENALVYANRSLYGPFIRQMVNGTLPKAAFKYYLHQDNLYLSKYARAFGVMGAKASKTDELAWLLNKSEPCLSLEIGAATTVAYTSFFSEAAWSEDMLLAYASVLPCQRLYDWLFSTIYRHEHISDENPYKEFITQYADPSNHVVTLKMESFLERYAAGITKESMERAQLHYDTAMRYEAQFFDQALHACKPGCTKPQHVESQIFLQPQLLAARAARVQLVQSLAENSLPRAMICAALLLCVASCAALLIRARPDGNFPKKVLLGQVLTNAGICWIWIAGVAACGVSATAFHAEKSPAERWAIQALSFRDGL